MDDVMIVILPLLYQRFMQLFTHNDSDQSALIQKQILKIFHAFSQVYINIYIHWIMYKCR
jgi:dihydrodipicolinate synthase/N-acetylneuraminate lyase